MNKNTLYQKALHKQNQGRPPVWFMRQAGRYHRHYQALKKNHSFIELCKNPVLACETTLGPIEDFNFDAAILFSDLLFPLEALGMGLEYTPGPKLSWHLRELTDLKKINTDSGLIHHLAFQKEALELIRKKLPEDKGLIGFVGAPLTLYVYAVEGSHKNGIDSAIAGLHDGRWMGFNEHLLPLLLENMFLQAETDIDALALFDTCAGDLSLKDYEDYVKNTLHPLLKAFKAKKPNTSILYYSKNTSFAQWNLLKDLPIQCMGMDWNTDLSAILKEYHSYFSIQGNFDPHLLKSTPQVFEKEIHSYFQKIKELPKELLTGWICGLGHGVLPETPEENVKNFMKIQKEYFGQC